MPRRRKARTTLRRELAVATSLSVINGPVTVPLVYVVHFCHSPAAPSTVCQPAGFDVGTNWVKYRSNVNSQMALLAGANGPPRVRCEYTLMRERLSRFRQDWVRVNYERDTCAGELQARAGTAWLDL